MHHRNAGPGHSSCPVTGARFGSAIGRVRENRAEFATEGSRAPVNVLDGPLLRRRHDTLSSSVAMHFAQRSWQTLLLTGLALLQTEQCGLARQMHWFQRAAVGP
jgi:hypothetical protein